MQKNKAVEIEIEYTKAEFVAIKAAAAAAGLSIEDFTALPRANCWLRGATRNYWPLSSLFFKTGLWASFFVSPEVTDT